MTEKKNGERAAGQTQNHRSLAENIGTSGTLEDFGGGRGQAAGMQTTVSSRDQFDEDVTQLAAEDDFADKATPRAPTDYFDDAAG